MLSAGVKTYAYDLAGNVSSVTNTATSQTTNLTWDADGRLTGIAYPGTATNGFAYNGLGQRVGKADSAGTFSYVLADDAIDSKVLSDGAASYVHGALGLVSETRGGATRYYGTDALGSTRTLTDGSGGVTDTRESDAFGNTWLPGTSGTTPTPFGFGALHGYQSDADSGLMRLGYRYYDPSTGRFLSRDPSQDGYNWYAYCGNDPVNAVDPEGLQYGDILRPALPLLPVILPFLPAVPPPVLIGIGVIGVGLVGGYLLGKLLIDRLNRNDGPVDEPGEFIPGNPEVGGNEAQKKKIKKALGRAGVKTTEENIGIVGDKLHEGKGEVGAGGAVSHSDEALANIISQLIEEGKLAPGSGKDIDRPWKGGKGRRRPPSPRGG
jgi:RHS repeat-associated protein